MTVPTVTFDKISTIVTPIISWHVTILPGSVSQLVTIPDCLSHYSLFTVPPIAKAGNSLNTLSLFCQLSVVLTHDTITTFAWLRTRWKKEGMLRYSFKRFKRKIIANSPIHLLDTFVLPPSQTSLYLSISLFLALLVFIVTSLPGLM